MKKLIIMCNNSMKVYVFDFDMNMYCNIDDDPEEGIQEFLDTINSNNIIETYLKISEISWMIVDRFLLEMPTLE